MSEQTKHRSFRTVIGILWPFLRPYKWMVILSILCLAVSTAVDILMPIAVGKVVDLVSLENAYGSIARLSLMFLGLLVLKFGFQVLTAYTIQLTGQNFMLQLRMEIYHRLMHFPLSYFDKHPTGRAITRMINDVKSLGEVFGASISVVLLDVAIILGTVGTMLYLNPVLASAILIPVPIAFVIVKKFETRLSQAYRSARQALSEMNAFLGENLAALSVIQRLEAQNERLAAFSQITQQHYAAQISTVRLYSLLQPTINTLNGLSTTTLIIFGGSLALQGKLTIGTLVAFLGYLRNLYQPLRDIVEKYNLVLSARVSAERVVDVFEQDQEKHGGHTHPTAQMLSIEFENVMFRYSEDGDFVLKNVSFKINPGEVVGIIGPTGKGKTTILKLILGLYRPQSGRILIDGIDVQDWDLKALRTNVGAIHQDIFVFEGTVFENIALASPNVSREDAQRAIEQAQLSSTIQQRGGLDMALSAGGSELSLGERQLLAFARMLAGHHAAILLDEATASVDTTTEQKLIKCLHEVATNRTVVIVAHRTSTLKRCSRVFNISELSSST